ncbi:hypothetical protein EYF80_015646 [Liparis tanakae]|uniref:Uncharacterized protein n=1 Tax=Liparis tanakae TaxID=230148 RepID=A0A4Z2I8X4_9TELE|nr:hypothetical protein EYF80_015646 [Liparis tanakae]
MLEKRRVIRASGMAFSLITALRNHWEQERDNRGLILQEISALQPGIAAPLAQNGALQRRRGLARQAEGRHLKGGGQAEGALGDQGGELGAVHGIWGVRENRH